MMSFLDYKACNFPRLGKKNKDGMSLNHSPLLSAFVFFVFFVVVGLNKASAAECILSLLLSELAMHKSLLTKTTTLA